MANRAEQEKTERRRKRGNVGLPGLKLSVNEDLLDRKRFVYRFANDDGGRIEQLTKQDDYEFVRDPTKEVKGDATDMGSGVSVVVGKTDNGQPIRGYLLAKPKHYYEEDQKEKQAVIDRQMADIKRGKPEAAAQMGDNSYVPQGGISIRD